MTGGTLRDIWFAMDEVGVVFKLSRLISSVAVACLGVDDVTPVLGATHELLVVLVFTQGFGELGNSEVVEGIFQGT